MALRVSRGSMPAGQYQICLRAPGDKQQLAGAPERLNGLGPHDHGDLTDPVAGPMLTSRLAFEPHFVLRIVNDPGVPPECSAKAWRSAALEMCMPEQRYNGTVYDKNGPHAQGPDGGAPIDESDSAPTEPDTTPVGATNRGHDALLSRFDGSVAALDPPDILHWADAPGIVYSPYRDWREVAPTFTTFFFRMKAIASTHNPKDDCTCKMRLTTEMVNGSGSVGPSRVQWASCDK